jgi:hypothetical protein
MFDVGVDNCNDDTAYHDQRKCPYGVKETSVIKLISTKLPILDAI